MSPDRDPEALAAVLALPPPLLDPAPQAAPPSPLPALPPPLLDSAQPSASPPPPRPSPRPAHRTDHELIVLRAQTRPALRALCREARLGEADADDILQESLFIVWLRWPVIVDPLAFLLGTVRNRIAHYAERDRADRDSRVPFEPELLYATATPCRPATSPAASAPPKPPSARPRAAACCACAATPALYARVSNLDPGALQW